jgi:hypothetical protein
MCYILATSIEVTRAILLGLTPSFLITVAFSITLQKEIEGLRIKGGPSSKLSRKD